MRLAITKLGAISPLGMGYDALQKGLAQGTSGIGPQKRFSLPMPGGEVWGFAPEEILGRKGLRILDRSTRLVLSCIEIDLKAEIDAIGADEIGLALGTTYGSFPSMSHFATTYLTEGFRALNPRHFPNLVINAPPSQGNIRFGLTASSTTISNGITAGLDALIFGAMRLRKGEESAFLCGGAEEISEILCLAGAQRGHWSTASTGYQVIGPKSDGPLPGEGAAIALLEPEDAALARGAVPLAYLDAFATCFGKPTLNSDTGDSAALRPSPSPDAAIRVIRDVIAQAGINAEDIDFIAISADGHTARAQAESEALVAACGSAISSIPLIAYSAYWGDADGASSALQLAAAISDLQRDCLSGTPRAADASSIAPLWLPREPLPRPLQRCMVLSLGQQGGATAVLLTKPTPTT